MATIGNVSLEIGRIGNFMEFAHVWFRVSFSGGERNLNMPFVVRAELFGRDDAIDSDGSKENPPYDSRKSLDKRDDLVGEIGREKVRPDGHSFVDVEIRRVWEFGSTAGGIEDYHALVTAYPNL